MLSLFRRSSADLAGVGGGDAVAPCSKRRRVFLFGATLLGAPSSSSPLDVSRLSAERKPPSLSRLSTLSRGVLSPFEERSSGKRGRIEPPPSTSPVSSADDSDELQEPSDAPALRVHKVLGDGRCLFRSIARGHSTAEGRQLSVAEETAEADRLRLATCEIISGEKREWIEKTGVLEEDVETYCKRMKSSHFFGGEPEIFLLSEMLRVPVHVYVPGDDCTPRKLLEYGGAYGSRKVGPVRVLYNGFNHYDCLLAESA